MRFVTPTLNDIHSKASAIALAAISSRTGRTVPTHTLPFQVIPRYYPSAGWAGILQSILILANVHTQELPDTQVYCCILE